MPPVSLHMAVYTTWPVASFLTLRVTAACSSASASGPTTSNLRSGDRSITTAPSRQAQYSSIAPWLSKLVGSQ